MVFLWRRHLVPGCWGLCLTATPSLASSDLTAVGEGRQSAQDATGCSQSKDHICFLLKSNQPEKTPDEPPQRPSALDESNPSQGAPDSSKSQTT